MCDICVNNIIVKQKSNKQNVSTERSKKVIEQKYFDFVKKILSFCVKVETSPLPWDEVT